MSLCCLVCSKKCWQPTKISVQFKARLSLVPQMQRWRKDCESQKGNGLVIAKWLKTTFCFPGSRKKLCLPMQVSSSLLLILLQRTTWGLELLEMSARVPGSSNRSSSWGKTIPSRNVQNFITHSAHALWKRRSSDIVGDGLYCHRGGWTQAALGHCKAKHWRCWTGQLYKLSNNFLNTAE